MLLLDLKLNIKIEFIVNCMSIWLGTGFGQKSNTFQVFLNISIQKAMFSFCGALLFFNTAISLKDCSFNVC